MWQTVTALKKHKSQGPIKYARKPKHIFSGLIKCGFCGASYTVFSSGRLVCAGNRERGDCDNKRTITRCHIEKRVLAAMQSHLAEPELIAEYVKAYQEERKKLQQAERGNAKQKQIASLRTEIDRGVDLLLKGLAPESLAAKIKQMEVELKQLEAEVQEFTSSPVEIHPAATAKYKRIIANLHEHINGDSEMFAEVRKLIDKIVVTPKCRELDILVHGQLAALLSVQDNPQCMGLVVAGARFELTTFGL